MLTDRFDYGELPFDTLSPPGPRLSKVFTKGYVKWGIRDVRDIQTWNPRLRFLERTSVLAGYEIETSVVRLIYRLSLARPFGSYDVLNRFEYSARRENGVSGA